MSDMEYNKGKLIPFDISYEDFFEKLGGSLDDIDDGYSKEEWCRDNCYESGYEIICGNIYKVDWKVKRSDEIPEVLNLVKNSDGSIDFETYHYNGGAYWTELVKEGILK